MAKEVITLLDAKWWFSNCIIPPTFITWYSTWRESFPFSFIHLLIYISVDLYMLILIYEYGVITIIYFDAQADSYGFLIWLHHFSITSLLSDTSPGSLSPLVENGI